MDGSLRRSESDERDRKRSVVAFDREIDETDYTKNFFHILSLRYTAHFRVPYIFICLQTLTKAYFVNSKTRRALISLLKNCDFACIFSTLVV